MPDLIGGMGPSVVLFGVAGGPQITAALLDLAARGHMQIWFHHLDTGRPRTPEDVLFEQVPEADGELTDAEAELLERVFSHGDLIGVDTLRRLVPRWPAELATRLAMRVGLEPSTPPAPQRRGSALGIVAGVLALAGGIGVGASIAFGALRAPVGIGLAIAAVLAVALVAERLSTRSRRVPLRRALTVGQRLLLYRDDLRELVASAGPLRSPADYDRLLGRHHPWAISLELVPDWLSLPDPGQAQWDRAATGSRKAVWVRRARPIPVVRNTVSLRIAHRIPAPRKPRD